MSSYINGLKGQTKDVKFCKVVNHQCSKFYVKCYCSGRSTNYDTSGNIEEGDVAKIQDSHLQSRV